MICRNSRSYCIQSNNTIKRLTITGKVTDTDRDVFLDELLITLAEADVANDFDDVVGYYTKQSIVNLFTISGSLNDMMVNTVENEILNASITQNSGRYFLSIKSEKYLLQVSIMDRVGQIISNHEMVSDNQHICVYDLSEGLYFIRMSYEDKKTTIPFVKIN